MRAFNFVGCTIWALLVIYSHSHGAIIKKEVTIYNFVLGLVFQKNLWVKKYFLARTKIFCFGPKKCFYKLFFCLKSSFEKFKSILFSNAFISNFFIYFKSDKSFANTGWCNRFSQANVKHLYYIWFNVME